MKRAEANFTALMEAIGGFVCRIGDWVSIIYGHIKGVLIHAFVGTKTPPSR
jgi:hypothetical protein